MRYNFIISINIIIPMKRRPLLMWMRRHGMLCRKYKYIPPRKPRIQSTYDPGPADFNEIYENLKKNQKERDDRYNR